MEFYNRIIKSHNKYSVRYLSYAREIQLLFNKYFNRLKMLKKDATSNCSIVQPNFIIYLMVNEDDNVAISDTSIDVVSYYLTVLVPMLSRHIVHIQFSTKSLFCDINHNSALKFGLFVILNANNNFHLFSKNIL
jgi:hypothetical protein